MTTEYRTICVTQEYVTEIKPNHLVTSASDIELPPGLWPKSIRADLGNGEIFIFQSFQKDEEGDILLAKYRQLYGSLILEVIND